MKYKDAASNTLDASQQARMGEYLVSRNLLAALKKPTEANISVLVSETGRLEKEGALFDNLATFVQAIRAAILELTVVNVEAGISVFTPSWTQVWDTMMKLNFFSPSIVEAFPIVDVASREVTQKAFAVIFVKQAIAFISEEIYNKYQWLKTNTRPTG